MSKATVSRRSLTDVFRDPGAAILVAAFTWLGSMVGAAISRLEGGFDTSHWLFFLAIGFTAFAITVLVAIRWHSHLTRSLDWLQKGSRLVLVLLLCAPFWAAWVWWIHYRQASGEITGWSGGRIVSGPCSLGNDGGNDSVDLASVPEAANVLLVCIPARRSSQDPVLAKTDDRRRISGSARNVKKNLWLEVYLPTQSLSNQTVVQKQPEWFYSPVVPGKGASWSSLATIGARTDTTAKLYLVRLLACSDAATQQILDRSYVQTDMTSPGAAFRYSYPWGHGCGKPLDERAVLVQAP